MRIVLSIIICILLSGCAKNPESFIEHLNGYWEIENVVLANGDKRNYTFNETIDFFSIKENVTGYRKKLKPNYIGSFESSNNAEKFVLKIENDSLHIYYETPFATWRETILFANQTQLKVINQNKVVFLYKRFIPLNLE